MNKFDLDYKMFAKISYMNQIFCVKVKKANVENDEEFDNLISEIESLYNKIEEPFMLVLYLDKMNQITLPQAFAWMSMFMRVLNITKTFLKCTFVSINSTLQEPVDMFLKIYNPIKPFRVFYDKESLKKEVEKMKANQ